MRLIRCTPTSCSTPSGAFSPIGVGAPMLGRILEEMLATDARVESCGTSCGCAEGAPAAAPARSEQPATTARKFPIDLFESDSHFVVRGSLPGVKKDHVQVELHEGSLTITATRSIGPAEGERALHVERTGESLSRTIRFATPIQSDGTSGELTDGVLTLRLRKAVPPATKIRID